MSGENLQARPKKNKVVGLTSGKLALPSAVCPEICHSGWDTPSLRGLLHPSVLVTEVLY